MHACPSCDRHLMGTPTRCPFCDTRLVRPTAGRSLQAIGASATAMVLAACYGPPRGSWKAIDTSEDTGGDTGESGEDGLESTDVVLSLDSSGVAISIVNAETAFDFGIVEQGACGDDCWEAESCEGETAGYSFCHDAGVTGVLLSLVTSPDEVVDSSTTLFSSANTNDLGFVLDSGVDCYVWGDAADYWSSWDCTVW